MTEKSFPVVGQKVGAAEWEAIALGLGQGVIDRGGWPYLIGARDNVNNTVTINVDQVTGRNEAILSGFVHQIDTAKSIPIPAVTTTTTYEVGLVYDPLKHGTLEGPITLTAWTQPADNSQNKSHLVLYKITRSPNQLLSDAPVVENRQRVSSQFAVSQVTDLPDAANLLVDTVALVRQTNEWYRLNKATDGTISWTLVDGGDGAVDSATSAPTPNTIAKRDASGRLQVVAGSGQNVVNADWIWANASGANDPGKLVVRGADANFLVPAPTHVSHPTPKSYVDGKTWDAERLNKAGNAVWWELITGSKTAYSNTNLGSTYATVAVSSAGLFGRWTSALKYKTDIHEWKKDPADVLKATPITYTDKASGSRRVGFIADSQVSNLGELVEYGEDGEVEGFTYMLLGVAQQIVLRDHEARLRALKDENEDLKNKLSALADRVTKLEN